MSETQTLWEVINPTDCTARARRMQVPGGWLYQVEIYSDQVEIYSDSDTWEQGARVTATTRSWSPPVFVALCWVRE